MGSNGVYPVRREKFASRLERYVERGIAKTAAALGSRYDDSAKTIGSSKRGACALEIAVRDGITNRARRDRHTNGIELSVDSLHAKAVRAAELDEPPNITLASPADTVVVPHDELTHAVALTQHVEDERFGGQRRKPARERKNDDQERTAVDERLELFVIWREQHWCGRRINHVERMRAKRDEHRRQFRRGRSLLQPANNVPMAEVDTVKGPDRGNAAVNELWQPAGGAVTHR